MSSRTIPQALRDTAVEYWVANKKTSSEEEVALKFGISSTMLSKELAEAGHKTLASYKTKDEHKILLILRRKKIFTSKELQNFLNNKQP